VIAFQTLLLGLAFGVQPVKLMVAPQVRSVEVRLDDVTIGVLAGEPWTIWCDLGGSPHPHELVAIARDGSGKEIGRARQWVNMPRPSAEATLLLERGPQPGQVVAARLAWNDAKGTEPRTVAVTLDGKALTVKDPRRFEVPPCDPKQAHILTAELLFPEGRTARTDAAFGGDIGEEAQSELTGLPVVLEPGNDLPAPPDFQGCFWEGDAPLRVLGVERAPFDVGIVLDQKVRAVLAREYGERGVDLQYPGRTRQASQLLVFDPAGHNDNRLFIVFGVPELFYGIDGSEHVLFPAYMPMEFSTFKFRARLANLVAGPIPLGAQTLADAVASNGALVAASNRPRAVVLLLAGSPRDGSAISPAAARAYLKDMHVPLLVWALLRGADTDGWGTAEDVSSGSRMDQAAKHLRDQLRQQRIVWLEGAHLPQRIRLAEGVRGVHLAP
jgi:hypothetical protein